MAHCPPEQQYPIPDGILVVWINDYECWAARSVEEAVAASMAMTGCTEEETKEDVNYIERDLWDHIKLANDEDGYVQHLTGEQYPEVDWEATPYETLRESIASNESFPALVIQRE